MSEIVILGKDFYADRDAVLDRYRHDAVMIEILKHAYSTQLSLDEDIRGWRQPVTGDLAETIAFVEVRRPKGPAPAATPYDYRRHARFIASQLLFKVTDGLPHQLARRVFVEDRWNDDDRRDYWRCVAICSAVWEEKA